MNANPVSYEDGLREYHLLCSRAAGITVIVLILLGISLDYFVYPEQQKLFAWARGIASLFIAFSLILLNTKAGRQHVQLITFIWLMSPQIMIAWMIYATQGEASLFYAGIILSIFAVGTLFPVGHFHTLALGCITLVFYFLACVLRRNGIQDLNQFAFHSIIILFATVGSAVYTYFNERIRRQLFSLKEEVSRKNMQLEETNKNLAEIKGHMLQQEKMAALGTLSAGLLHEVNNPVNYCLMALDVAKEKPAAKSDAGLRECLDDARQGMVRVQQIVSDLKKFAYRPHNASAAGAPFPFDQALDTAIRMVGFEIKGLAITRDLPDDTRVYGDETAIIGVLVNLLDNAALAMRTKDYADAADAPAIRVSAAWQGDRLRVAVRDNGPGIAPGNLARVFEPFFTTREIGRGLGLGLSIGFGVIERHGGKLVAESEYGKWTEMIFDLPRAA